MLRSRSSACSQCPSCPFTLKVSHAPISVECLFSLTLLPIHPEGIRSHAPISIECLSPADPPADPPALLIRASVCISIHPEGNSRSDIGPVLVINDPAGGRVRRRRPPPRWTSRSASPTSPRRCRAPRRSSASSSARSAKRTAGAYSRPQLRST